MADWGSIRVMLPLPMRTHRRCRSLPRRQSLSRSTNCTDPIHGGNNILQKRRLWISIYPVSYLRRDIVGDIVKTPRVAILLQLDSFDHG
jgi:hypothetical protein